MPHQLAAKVRDNLDAPFIGLRFEQAQYARTSAGGIWVVSGLSTTCLVQDKRGAVACTSTEEATRHGLVLGVFNAPERPTEMPKDFLLLGVAPDWAKIACLKTGNRVRRVAIHDNAFALRAQVPILLDCLEA